MLNKEGGREQGKEDYGKHGTEDRQRCTRKEQGRHTTINLQADRQDQGKHWVKSLFQVAFCNVTHFKTAFN